MVDVRDSIKIENVVAFATLDQKIDLDAVVKGNLGVEYDPATFPGLVYKIKKSRTSILIFRTGKWFAQEPNHQKKRTEQSRR